MYDHNENAYAKQVESLEIDLHTRFVWQIDLHFWQSTVPISYLEDLMMAVRLLHYRRQVRRCLKDSYPSLDEMDPACQISWPQTTLLLLVENSKSSGLQKTSSSLLQRRLSCLANSGDHFVAFPRHCFLYMSKKVQKLFNNVQVEETCAYV